MSHRKQGLKALGLCFLAALGLTAFLAASAQAQTGWLVNKAFIGANKGISGEIHTLPNGKKHAILLTTVGAGNTPLEILCEKLETKEGSIFSGEKAEGLIVLNYSSCKSFLNKVESLPCKPNEPIVAKTKFHAILHTTGDKKTYILFEPEVAGGAFTTIEVGEECSFTSTKVTGELVAECLNEKLEKNLSTTDYCLEDSVNHLLQEVATRNLFPLEGKEWSFDELKFGTRPALLDGIAKTFLSAPETGKTWAVHI